MVKEDIQEIIKEISTEYLQSYPVTIQIKEGLKTFEKVQETLINLANSEDDADLVKIRIGTALTWELVNRIANGKNLKELSSEEWGEIVLKVSDNSINISGQEYSKKVFIIYADYIEISAKYVEKTAGDRVSKDKIAKIKSLSKEIHNKSDKLDKGIITEVSYIEDCLWISLEAMIKLLSATAGKYACQEVSVLIDGVTQYAFEYGRLALYHKELDLLEEILAHQGKVDIKLQEKYDEYIKELSEKTEGFSKLIDEAFTDDFRSQLRGSVALAKEVGINEEEILDSIDKIDDFFN